MVVWNRTYNSSKVCLYRGKGHCQMGVGGVMLDPRKWELEMRESQVERKEKLIEGVIIEIIVVGNRD